MSEERDLFNPNPNPDLATYNRQKEIQLRQWCMGKAIEVYSSIKPENASYLVEADNIYAWVIKEKD
jgi:hypothetical protein